MPEISEAAGYLVALLHSAGVASSTGMGLVGLSWQEIEAWARCNDFVVEGPDVRRKRAGMRSVVRKRSMLRKSRGILSPRELRAVFLLSRAYANEYSEASKKGAKPPYTPPVEYKKDEVVREMVEEKVEDVFEAMIKAQTRD